MSNVKFQYGFLDSDGDYWWGDEDDELSIDLSSVGYSYINAFTTDEAEISLLKQEAKRRDVMLVRREIEQKDPVAVSTLIPKPTGPRVTVKESDFAAAFDYVLAEYLQGTDGPDMTEARAFLALLNIEIVKD
jgi:hypothetical protein